MTAREKENHDEEIENISEDEQFEVFYNKEQIQATQIQQNTDLFEEIVTKIKKDQQEDPTS